MVQGPNWTGHLFWRIKFYWITPMIICVWTVCACFYTMNTTAGLSRILILWLFTVCWLLICFFSHEETETQTGYLTIQGHASGKGLVSQTPGHQTLSRALVSLRMLTAVVPVHLGFSVPTRLHAWQKFCVCMTLSVCIIREKKCAVFICWE